MKGKNLTFAELQKKSNNLANYVGGNGYAANFRGDNIGVDSPQFQQAKQMARVYNISITNAQAAVKTIILFPGLIYTNVLTELADGVLRTATDAYPSAEGTAATFTSSGSPASIELMENFVRMNPTVLVGMKFDSTVATQKNLVLTLEKQSPFNVTNQVKQLSLTSYHDENAFSEKIVTVPILEQLDNQTSVTCQIAPSSTLTLTLFLGVVDNSSANFYQTIFGGGQ